MSRKGHAGRPGRRKGFLRVGLAASQKKRREAHAFSVVLRATNTEKKEASR